MQSLRKDIAGERRLVTILFCDVKGSTAFAEHLDPEDWAEIMNRAFELLTQPVLQYGGTVARLMGDAILAFFGAPTAHEDDPLRAVLAGLEIVSRIEAFSQQLRTEYGLDFAVRIGINTGEVVVAEMGSALAGEYTAMGDAVNLAARMEQTAAPGTIQITAQTRRLVDPWIETEPLGSSQVRGKSEPVEVFRVLGRRKTPERARGIRGLTSPLVAREMEFSILQDALTNLKAGRTAIISLIGEAGLGKSRLIEEFKTLIGSREPDGPAVRWIESRGISFEMARPYGLFQQHLRSACDLNEDDTPQVVREKIWRTFPDLAPDHRDAILATIELLLSLGKTPQPMEGPDSEESTSSTPHPEGESLKREIFAGMLHLWEAMAQSTPLIMVFDDLHWSDSASVELILHLFQLTDRTPILFLCAFRPYRNAPAWNIKTYAETHYPHRYQEVNLAPLDEQASSLLVDNLLAISDLPTDLRQTILHKSEGNPFFLEEVIRALIDQQVIQYEAAEKKWRAVKAFQAVEIPDSLQALLLSRVDRLEPKTRRTLQLASVIGRTFSYRVLKAVLGSNGDLDADLAVLQRVDLIQESRLQPEKEFTFRHELTRDAAYESILRRQRREYHLKVAQVIEGLHSDHLEEVSHRLADHYEQARALPQALRYYELAGERAARLYANAEACENFTRAIQIARQIEVSNLHLVRLYLNLGRSLELLNLFDRALETYKELEAQGQHLKDRTLELSAILPQAIIHSVPTIRFDPARGAELARRALSLAIELGDTRAEARALWSLLLIENFGSGNTRRAIEYGEQGLRIARENDLREELAQIYHDIARPYMRLGRLQDAWEAYHTAQAYWWEVDNQPMLADSLASLAESLYYTGELRKAHEYAGEALRISQKIESLWGQAYAHFTLGVILNEFGEVDACLESLNACLEFARRGNFTAGMIGPLMVRSWILASMGDLAGAQSAAARMMESIDDFPAFEPMYRLTIALNRMYAGELDEAMRLYQSLGEAHTLNAEMIFSPYVYSLEVELYLRMNDYERALQRTDDYLRLMQASGFKALLPDLRSQRARALVAMGRTAEAHQELQAACELATRLDMRRILWSVLIDLADLESDPQLAESHRTRARQVITFITDHISDPSLRRSFSSLPAMGKVKLA